MITSESKALSERKAVVWAVRAISYLVYFYLIVVEIILVIGFFLLLFGANPTAGFTQWAYRNLDRVMAPFRGIFSPIELGTTGNDVAATFDTSVLFAMIIYGIVALLFSALIGWLSTRLNQIHAAEDELERQAEIAQQQADADARMQAAAAAAGQPAQPVAPTTTSPSPATPPPAPIPPSTPTT
ncbi:MAG TPA: hypothetical protein VMY16_00525 [Ilumatobacteraceae bacterium]|nr:hypothetical protein [Ilumatobacteraceae bacterium]